MNLGTKMRLRREQLGLSQVELARRMGLTQGRISEWESGARTQMNLQNLRSLARALGVSADYLLGTWEEAGESAGGAEVAAPARRRGRPRKAPAAAAHRS
jgi:transcriptional regulator with XRE-family HTH domain